MRYVEIFSATDPPYFEDRQVRYWAVFDGVETQRFTEWGPVNEYAQNVCAENPDVAIIDRSDKGSGFLRALIESEKAAPPIAEATGPPVREERFYDYQGDTIIVRRGAYPWPWLVTWLPKSPESRNYPGFTISSADGSVPPGPTFEAVVEWVTRQPWATEGADPTSPPEEHAEGVEVLDVPTAEWEEAQHQAFEQNLRLGFTKEPDGGYSWAVLSEDGVPLQSGIAATWDDARLAMIENIYPRSGEADKP